MISRTTRAIFDIPTPLFVAVVVFLITGCATGPEPPPLPEMTQLQIRQIQTKEYDGIEEKAVIKALIAALQDEGFIISAANPELGLVTAAMEIRDEDKGTKSWVEFWYGPGIGTYRTTKRLEASATVQKQGAAVRVRINIVAKALTNAGGVVWSQPVYDAKVYQDIFSKVDKAVFLEKEKV
jgi:hypothetical protein